MYKGKNNLKNQSRKFAASFIVLSW